MCLGIPVKIIAKKGLEAEVEMGGIHRAANLSFTPEAQVGEYILLHAGFAIEVLDTEEARERLEIIRQIVEKSGD